MFRWSAEFLNITPKPGELRTQSDRENSLGETMIRQHAQRKLRSFGQDVRRITTVLALATILACLSAMAAFGQAITGTIVGTVVDSSGAAVAGADVVAKNIDTGLTYTTSTGSEGYFTLSKIPP